MTGVDRVAQELLTALQKLPEFQIRFSMQEVRPPKSLEASSGANQIRRFLWEQRALSKLSRRDLLFSPCNAGPVFSRNHIVFIHDAQAFHAQDSYSLAFRTYYKRLLPLLGYGAKAVVVPSEFTKAQLVQHKIAPGHNISVVPNGSDHILRIQPQPNTLQKFGLTDKKFFLAIGSLAPHKNLDMLARASHGRSDRDVPVVIAGGGDERIFRKIGIKQSRSLRLLGRVTDQELRALYAHATALLFPSKTEGFGLPAAEAMACGCPVVSTTAGAVPEVCGKATWSISPSDQQGWTTAMEKLSCDVNLQSHFSKMGKDRAAQFTWRAAAEKLLPIMLNCSPVYGGKSGRGSIGKVLHRSDQCGAR